MAKRQGHRKRVKHFHDPGLMHALTLSCFHRWPLLTNNTWREMLARSIDRAMDGHGYRLAVFVFMPGQVHLMNDPPRQYPDLRTIHSLPAD
jgi:putative transposase